MKRRCPSFLMFCLISLALLLPNGAVWAKDILVGASVALTGKYARTGQDQLNGYTMWVEDVNTRGGLLGRLVQMVHYDDESKPATGSKLYEKLITHDKVDLILGPYSSGVTLAASAVTEKYKFPMVSTGASASKIWSRGFRYVFGLYTPGETYMDSILEFAKDKGNHRVALIYADTTFPRAVAKGVKATLKKLGLELVLEEEYGKGATDFAAMLLKMKTRRPDVIVGGSYLPDTTAFIRQAKERRLEANIFAFAVGPGLEDFGTNLGQDANGVMGNTQWESTLNIPGAKAFSEHYEKKYGKKPGYHAAGGYGAGQVLEAAVHQAGSLDKEKLRDALQTMDITTVFGRYKVDETGKQVGKPGYAIQWIDGIRHMILPQEVATHEPIYPFGSWDKR